MVGKIKNSGVVESSPYRGYALLLSDDDLTRSTGNPQVERCERTVRGVGACMLACVHACMLACVRASVRVCMCVSTCTNS